MADWPIIAARPFRLDPRLVKQITASPCYLEFGAMPDSDTRTVEEPDVRTNRGDSDEVAHIVMKDDQMRGYMSGTPIQALCGKVWVPTRDYHGLPVCQRCVDKRDGILSGVKNLN